MKERPIIFSGEMVRAILDGRKTQTRWVLKPQPAATATFHHIDPLGTVVFTDGSYCRCPYGEPGDRLWVRETFAEIPAMKPAGYFTDPNWIDRKAWYRADNDRPTWGGDKWRPSIFMPRSFSRITLEVVAVRAERVQDITEADAKAEGASFHDGRGVGHSGWRHDFGDVYDDARSSFAHLWDSINAKRGYGWDANPLVRVVEFKRIGGES